MKNTTNEPIKRGVYFISNDNVFDLTVAFLNSFRKHNPSIALCLVPYNKAYGRIEALQSKYNFTLFPNTDLLEECDTISMRFHTRSNGSYRKLALWDGPFEEFIYIDVDTVVLKDVQFAFQFLADYDFLTSQSDIPEIRKHVWKDSILTCKSLSRTQIQYSANTGFITSRKGVIDFTEIKGKVEKALELKHHMELYCQEQPFLNYCMVTSNKSYTSLHALLNRFPGVMVELWAGITGCKVKDGSIELTHVKHPVFLVHWAGVWHPKTIDQLIYKVLRLFGYRSSLMNMRLPYKKLWLYYRFHECTVPAYQ